jgi:type II secretory pathway pseudopilin PulG
MRRRPPGLSLLEALITLLLIGIVVLLSSGLLNGMSRMNRRSQEGESSVMGLAALEAMRREVLEAVTITTPSSATFEGELIFNKINPNATGRLPNSPATWTPHAGPYTLTVKYSQEGDQVVRLATDSGGASSKAVVARDVEAFSAGRPRAEVVDLRLSFARGRMLISEQILARRYIP